MNIISKIIAIKRCMLTTRKNLGSAGVNAIIGKPVFITNPKNVHMEENSVIRLGAVILNNENEHVYIKKYSVIGVNCTIVTNGHRSTVGIPHVLLGASHINDKSKDIHIEEDVWIGVNVTILAGADIGRGCIVGACSTVTKPIPPYAIVIGSPSKIVGVKFSLEQIIEHEKMLYPENDRFSREYLEDLFAKYYEGLSVFGVTTEFSDEELEKIKEAKKLRGFVE